jgi:hypothetical protein
MGWADAVGGKGRLIFLSPNLPDSRDLLTLDRLMPYCGAIPVVGLTGMVGMSRHGRGYVLCEKNWMDWSDLPTQLRALFRQAQKGCVSARGRA